MREWEEVQKVLRRECVGICRRDAERAEKFLARYSKDLCFSAVLIFLRALGVSAVKSFLISFQRP
jgi:predicted dehydrogenase